MCEISRKFASNLRDRILRGTFLRETPDHVFYSLPAPIRMQIALAQLTISIQSQCKIVSGTVTQGEFKPVFEVLYQGEASIAHASAWTELDQFCNIVRASCGIADFEISGTDGMWIVSRDTVNGRWIREFVGGQE